jgi:hypothetical protein
MKGSAGLEHEANRTMEHGQRFASVKELMDAYGLDAEAAALIVAAESGLGLVNDVVHVPPISREEMYRRGITKPIHDRIREARQQVLARGNGDGKDNP